MERVADDYKELDRYASLTRRWGCRFTYAGVER